MFDFKNKTADVLGLGISNLPLIDFLLSEGAFVTARDRKAESELACAEALKAKGVALVCGEGYLDGLCGYYIFRSPGIRPDTPQIADAVKNGSVLTSEMELFFERSGVDIIAVTGSDGKTTTTTLVSLIIEAAIKPHRVFLGGNIGSPLLPRAADMHTGDIAVAELSSFQLMTMPRAPKIAVITNIAPNHLNWHTDMDEYVAAKARITGEGCECAVFNLDNAVTAKLCANFHGKAGVGFSRTLTPSTAPSNLSRLVWLDGETVTVTENGADTVIIKADSLLLPGAHNLENFMAAVGATFDYARGNLQIYGEIAENFGGVEHRCELVREKDGIRYYNSSIDSSPTRTNAALNALCKAGGIALIIGGCSKNIPLRPLAEAIYSHENVRAVILTGATADIAKAALDEYDGTKRPIEIHREDAFTDAVMAASDTAKKLGCDTVLLSPAFTSFDAFANFELRGKKFKEVVRSL